MSWLESVGDSLREKSILDHLKNNIYLVMLVIVFLFALGIRLIPLDSIKYLQALDPYMISRLSLEVAEKGSIPHLDILRYFPYVTPTYVLNLGNIYIPAYLFNLVNLITGIDFLTWSQIWPAIFGAILTVIMYFIGSEAFDKKSGLLAAFFLASSSAVLHRSSAGWFEKEPIGMLFILTSIYFLIRAWERESWPSGLLSGVSLAIAAASWGGTKFLFLLYPLTGLAVLLLNEDIDKIVVTFTPTLLLGNFLAAGLNASRWNVMNNMALASWALLGFIWFRYLVGEFNLMSKKRLALLPTATFLLSLLALALSPLYSQSLAGKFNRLISAAIRRTPGTVVNTVAENSPAPAGRVISKLGAVYATQKLPGFMAPFTELFSGWSLSLVGAGILTTVTLLMLLRNFNLYQKITDTRLYVSILVGTLAISSVFIYLLPGSPISAFLPAIGMVVLGLVIFGSKGSSLKRRSFRFRGYYLLILFWYLATIYATTQQNRILFLM